MSVLLTALVVVTTSTILQKVSKLVVSGTVYVVIGLHHLHCKFDKISSGKLRG